MDFRPNIERFMTGTYSVSRRGARTLTKGRADAAPTPTTLSIDASVQQATGRDLQVAPEGNWTGDTIKIYTATELLVQDATHEADLVTYKGATYEVRTCGRYDDLGKFFKALAVRVS